MNYESRNIPGIDRISDLPRELKENILVRLPVKEAVRTCCLSSTWRLAWSSIPELVYDEHSISTPKRLIYKNHTKVTMKMVKFVDKFLSFHNGSISKFVITDVIKRHNKALNKWMRVLLRKGIEKIQIPFEDLYGKRWKVPPVFWNLKFLKEVALENCVIKLPQAFQGLMLLKSLSLEQFEISNHDLTNLIASCPVLENLNLRLSSEGMDIVIGALKLKKLFLECWNFKHVCLRAPSTVKAVIFLWSDDLLLPCRSNLIDLMNCLSKLEILRLGGDSMRYLAHGYDPDLSIKFYHLKSLYMDMKFGCQREAAVVRQLFRRAPNLEKLRISAEPDSYDIGNPPKWDQCIVFEHLKLVKIMGLFKSDESVFPFFAFLLESTPVLEIFRFDLEVDNPEFLQKVVQLKRASEKAKIYNSEFIL